MGVEIIAVGTELSLGLVEDTNSNFLARELLNQGFECQRQVKIPDEVDHIALAVREALNRAEVVILAGGLGPTADDVTREAIAQALKRELIFEPKLAELIQKKFKKEEKLPEFVLKQAYLPKGAKPLLPSTGTAPGLIIEKNKKLLVALPGVPSEMKRMFKEKVLPLLKEKKPPKEIIMVKTIKTFGIRESFLAQKIGKSLEKFYPALTLAYLPRAGEVHLELKMKGKNEKEGAELLDQAQKELESLLSEVIYGTGEETLPQVVGKLLRKYRLKLSVAESITGGLIGDLITKVPGSSDYFWGAVTAYSNEVKRDLLEVPAEILLKEGAVSSQTALAMAEAAKKKMGVDIGLSITGIAGPTGATPEKPIGLVFIGISAKEKELWERFQFWGTRQEIKVQAAKTALNMLRLFLIREFEEEGSAA